MKQFELKVSCRNCGKEFIIKCDKKDLEDFLNGKKLIQRALPYLEGWERELLISQLCDDCFNDMIDAMAEEYYEFKYNM